MRHNLLLLLLQVHTIYHIWILQTAKSSNVKSNSVCRGQCHQPFFSMTDGEWQHSKTLSNPAFSFYTHFQLLFFAVFLKWLVIFRLNSVTLILFLITAFCLLPSFHISSSWINRHWWHLINYAPFGWVWLHTDDVIAMSMRSTFVHLRLLNNIIIVQWDCRVQWCGWFNTARLEKNYKLEWTLQIGGNLA